MVEKPVNPTSKYDGWSDSSVAVESRVVVCWWEIGTIVTIVSRNYYGNYYGDFISTVFDSS